MYNKNMQKGHIYILLVFGAILTGLFCYIFYLIFNNENLGSIDSFKKCKEMGFPILESYPEQCVTPDGRKFTNSISKDDRSCIQLVTSAKDLTGECKEFSTPCDVPGGWEKVESCLGNEGQKIDFEVIAATTTDYARKINEPILIDNIDDFKKIVNDETQIDFSKNIVIATFMPANTGGHHLDISEVLDKGEYLEVILNKTHPGKNCIVTQAIVFRSHLIKLQKTTKEIKFQIKEQDKDCN